MLVLAAHGVNDMNLPTFSLLFAALSVWAGFLLEDNDAVKSDAGRSWYRKLNLSASVNPRVEPFEIVGIESEDGIHLVGEFVYMNYKEGDKFPPSRTIGGSKKTDGTFWPCVVAQTSNAIDSQWTMIGNPPTPGEAVSLVVTSKQKQRFYVNLDMFRPMIGKMKYGKITLETGDSAIFEIDDLLPP